METGRKGQAVRDLGDGLILRRAVPEDVEALATFNGRILSEAPGEEPDQALIAWTRDLFQGGHPTVTPGDFTVVQDSRTGQIVSSLVVISQTWSYAGIPFDVGRIELVGTHPDYRRRGLVRAQFELVHQWGAERGQQAQAITGIPWYYRQFGYEMALDLGGSRAGFAPQVPKLKDGEFELFPIRPASAADLPFIAGLYAQGLQRSRVACLRDEAAWQYELRASPDSVARLEMHVIETAEGEPVGFFAHPAVLWRTLLAVTRYELKPGLSWLAVTPAVMRRVWAIGQEMSARRGKALEGFAFSLGREHPAYLGAADRLPRTRPPYAWYLRVADLACFLRHVAPALEQFLAGSHAAGHTANLELSFYRTGLRLVLDKGRLATIEPWQPDTDHEGDAGFPDLAFLQLLFGYRSLDELRSTFPDCWVANGEAASLLTALFPKQLSHVWPLA